MSTRFRRTPNDYELLPRDSLESDDFPELERHPSNSSWVERLANAFPGVKQISARALYTHYITPRRRKRSVLRLLYWTVFSIPYVVLFLVLFVGTFFPSYTDRPTHYEELRQLSLRTARPGRANIHNETVFIAAALYEQNGTLTSGAWGQEVLELVDLLGPQNVYLSIYENNVDPITRKSLDNLRKKALCNNTIVAEDLDLSTLPRVQVPDGNTRIKRVAFLADVRNRALAPIDKVGIAFDRILYINDVNFDPIEAAQLLFSTNVDSTGRASYAAACAVDFINPFKFYDRFATRDMGGFSMGIPFFPWFTSAGEATSRNDVKAGTDAVRVRSCWGGMMAYEARWFQDQELLPYDPSSNSPPSSINSESNVAPLRFRYEEAPFWDSSECCLVNADLAYRRTGRSMPADTGIYMNPFIRVAYDTKTLSWLALTRRPEKLYSWVHDILNHIVGFPGHNPRQTEEPGKEYTDTVWEYDDPSKAFAANATNEVLAAGHWVQESHIASPGGFCVGPNLLVINETPEQGEGNWGKIRPPAPPKP